jgi:hypothetical protein
MNERTVAEPPREGRYEGARYRLIADGETVGWTSGRRLAIAWRNGFGPGADVGVRDAVIGGWVGTAPASAGGVR